MKNGKELHKSKQPLRLATMMNTPVKLSFPVTHLMATETLCRRVKARFRWAVIEIKNVA
jgi:hypothetical protein